MYSIQLALLLMRAVSSRWIGQRSMESWKEELPPRKPEARGACFVHSDHACNKVTRSSHSGILIWVNNAPVIFHSKQQNTVESSTFGSELVAMTIAKELIVALKHKLRMFGMPVEKPANAYCDSDGVVKNTSILGQPCPRNTMPSTATLFEKLLQLES